MSEFKLSGNTFDSVEEDISILKKLFPSIVTGDNEIDFDELREIEWVAKIFNFLLLHFIEYNPLVYNLTFYKLFFRFNEFWLVF